jgi:DNA-binding Xre family transcriptional regulator
MLTQSMAVRCTLRLLIARENLHRAEQGNPTLSPADVAAGAKLPPSVVNGLVTGRQQRVDFKTIDRLCGFFKIQPGELFVWEPDADANTDS